MKRNIQTFWDTYGISKHEKLKQTKNIIYIYHSKTYILVELQKMYITRKEKYICVCPHRNVVQSHRTNNITRAWLPKQYLKYRYPSLHWVFWRFLIKVSFPLTLSSLFDFVQLKMRAIEPELLKSHGGHRPQPTLLTFLDWPNGPHWCESTTRATSHLAVFFSPNNDKSVHRFHFWTCSKTINSVVFQFHFTAYWAAKSDNQFAQMMWQNGIGLYIERTVLQKYISIVGVSQRDA